MSIADHLINELKSLPCFTQIQSVDLLAHGLSQTAIKVLTTSQVFFAKKLNQHTANSEIACALLCSNLASKNQPEQGNTKQLSPQVVYHDQHWLVTHFIHGLTLADTNLNNNKKIAIALNLMAQLHSSPPTLANYPIPQLNPSFTVNELLSTLPPLLFEHRNTLSKIGQSLSNAICSLITDTQRVNVVCHGDLNFTNVLQDNGNNAYLIDFECAQLAPPEFDLAMFIAVNNIVTQDITHIITEYSALMPSYRLNSRLLHYYLLYSLLINGLWYLANMKPIDIIETENTEIDNSALQNTKVENTEAESSEAVNKMYGLAIEQWSAFDRLSLQHMNTLPKLLTLIDNR
jgi:thiamine kinase-like enzyme